MKNYYTILGVDPSSSPEQIREAYKKLAHQFHPDRNKSSQESEEKFKEISEAYSVLKDENKKRQYDQRQHNEQFDFDPFDFDSFFSNSTFRHHSKPNSDISININLTLEEAYLGCTKEIRIKRKVFCSNCSGLGGKIKPCSKCNGSGYTGYSHGFMKVRTMCAFCYGQKYTVIEKCGSCNGNKTIEEIKDMTISVPRGINNGITIIVHGEGNLINDRTSRGNVLCSVNIKEHDNFLRDNNDLIYDYDLDCINACLGKKISINTINNQQIQLDIPSGTQHGTLFRIPSFGMPIFQSNIEFGDLFVRVSINIPKNFTQKQIDLLQQIQSLN